MEQMKQYIKNMREVTNKNINDNIGLTTGFEELNLKMSGFKNQELTVIASRIGYGKTALVLNSVIENIKDDSGVLYFSLDLQKEQILTRIIAMESKVRLAELKRGILTQDEKIIVDDTIDKYTDAKLLIDDTKYPTLEYIENKIKSIASNKENVLKIVVIDYIDLIDNSSNQNIARELKKFAIKYNLPIIVLSQLSNKIEKRLNQRPQLNDLKDKNLKIEADLVLFLYINDFVQKDLEEQKEIKSILKNDYPEYKSAYVDKPIVSADIIIAKQKHGGSNLTVKLDLLKDMAIFYMQEKLEETKKQEIFKEIDEILKDYEEGYKYRYGLPFKKEYYIDLDIIDAYELNLSKIPNEIYKLKDLRILRLQKNNLTSLSKKISTFKNLETICLCDNKLTKLPKNLITLKNLTELGLCNNPTLKKLPDSFKNLQLKSLSIDGKLLNKYIDILSQIKTIEELEIHGGKISKKVFRKLTTLPNLKELTFEAIKNKRFPKKIKQFKVLEKLTIEKSDTFLQYDNNITEDIFLQNIKLIEINNKELINV